ncbi:MAG: hypothetical protein A3G24_04790 [Betaproteobacteria bacterium RIFCSPLOWO2_12_FULL_62_13]|nr:MAG: hypothetical protein A3G24_04790 [Betaproteobacteria bacterium RIFCSPLOWO2_12_FULL_62_13]
MNRPSETKPRRHRALRIASVASVVAIALLLVYALAGFVLAPWLAKRELQRIAEEQLQRRARVAKIAFNPFTLALRMQQFALEEKDGRPMLGFREATANVEWRSLLRRGLVLSDPRVTEPALHVEISKEGHLNLADLARKSLDGRWQMSGQRNAPNTFLTMSLVAPTGFWRKAFSCWAVMKQRQSRSRGCRPAGCAALSRPTSSRASGNSRAAADARAAPCVSRQHDGIALGIRRRAALPVFAPVFQDQRDRISQALARFFLRAALTIRAGNFRAIGDEPLSVALDDGGELVSHGFTLTVC